MNTETTIIDHPEDPGPSPKERKFLFETSFDVEEVLVEVVL